MAFQWWKNIRFHSCNMLNLNPGFLKFLLCNWAVLRLLFFSTFVFKKNLLYFQVHPIHPKESVWDNEYHQCSPFVTLLILLKSATALLPITQVCCALYQNMSKVSSKQSKCFYVPIKSSICKAWFRKLTIILHQN